MPRLPQTDDIRQLAGLRHAPRVAVSRGGCHGVEAVWQGRTMAHPQPGFYIVDRPGMLAEDADGRRWPYRLDAITVIPPWFRYTYRFEPGQRHGYLHAGVPQWPGAVLRRLWTEPLYLEDRALLRRFRAWCRMMTGPASEPERHFAAGGLAWDLIAALLAAHPQAAAVLLAGSSPWVALAPALDLVEDQLHRPLGVGDLARALQVGREHCARLFRRHLGQSPVTYLQERRVARASSLLRSTEWSVDRIAAACGCGSRQHLTRLFRRHLHSTPSAWRGTGGG